MTTVNGQLTTDFAMKRFRQRYHDCFSHIYDRFVALHSTDKGARLCSFLADSTGLSKGDKALDICTGTGTLLGYLREKVQEKGFVTGALNGPCEGT